MAHNYICETCKKTKKCNIKGCNSGCYKKCIKCIKSKVIGEKANG